MADAKTLFAQDVHIGHRTFKWCPLMAPYIHEKMDGVHVFDLTKTAEALEKVTKLMETLKKQGGKVLFVGTKPQAAHVLQQQMGDDSKFYYIDQKWSPGLLTNFTELRRRIDFYLNLKSQFETGEINKYTKKEVAKFRKDLDKLHASYHGVAEMRKRPDIVVVLDAVGNRLAIAEANKCNVGVVAVCDSNADPRGVDYVIGGNDDSVKSLGVIVETLTAALR